MNKTLLATLLLCVSAAICGCSKQKGCPPGPCINPQEYGNAAVFNGPDIVMYYSDHGNDQQLCGIVSLNDMHKPTPESDWQAWSLRDNWNHHHFNTPQEAKTWLTTTWCKP